MTSISRLSFLLFAVGAQAEEKILCTPPALRTPLQKLEVELSWSGEKSHLEDLQTRLGNLYRLESNGLKVASQAVKKGYLCELVGKVPYAGRVLAPLVCEECTEGCLLQCIPHKEYRKGATGDQGTTRETCRMAVPANCVILDGKVPEGLEAKWSINVDQRRVFSLVFGIFFLLFYQPLGRSRLTHSTLGAALGISLAFVLVLWWSWKQARSTIPFAQSTLAILNMSFILAPSVGLYFFHQLAPSWTWMYAVLKNVAQFRDPYYHVPVGFIFLILSVLAGTYIGRQVFGSRTFEEFSGEIRFRIASNGARIDDVDEGTDPTAQKALQWFLFAVGFALILKSTTIPAMNLTLLVILILGGPFWSLLHMLVPQTTGDAPVYGGRLNAVAYEKEKKDTTDKELAKLREFLNSKSGQKHLGRVKNQNAELNLRRFAEGASHVHALERDDLADEMDEGPRRRFGFF